MLIRIAMSSVIGCVVSAKTVLMPVKNKSQSVSQSSNHSHRRIITINKLQKKKKKKGTIILPKEKQLMLVRLNKETAFFNSTYLHKLLEGYVDSIVNPLSE